MRIAELYRRIMDRVWPPASELAERLRAPPNVVSAALYTVNGSVERVEVEVRARCTPGSYAAGEASIECIGGEVLVIAVGEEPAAPMHVVSIGFSNGEPTEIVVDGVGVEAAGAPIYEVPIPGAELRVRIAGCDETACYVYLDSSLLAADPDEDLAGFLKDVFPYAEVPGDEDIEADIDAAAEVLARLARGRALEEALRKPFRYAALVTALP